MIEGERYTLHHGDNRIVLATLEDNSVDAIVCDPPYELGFMGKAWDSTGIAYDVAMWRECWRVLKHGGHLLAFGGSRTYHRMACAIEDAGFEIRDQIMWVYGSGFPKSLNVGKAIDREAGAERAVTGLATRVDGRVPELEPQNSGHDGYQGGWGAARLLTEPATAAAEQWDGWGTALKPAHEPIVVARKPLSEGTVAANVLKWGTGGMNVDGCRVGTSKEVPGTSNSKGNPASGWGFGDHSPEQSGKDPNIGRWPANLIHDGSEEVVAGFPETTSGAIGPKFGDGYRGQRCSGGWKSSNVNHFPASEGSAARFFYCAKASKEDRDEGCEALEERASHKAGGGMLNEDGEDKWQSTNRRNHHATVKPTELMRYLCRLVTPPSGIVLDPFAGSGSTGKGAILEGFYFVGIELEADHVAIAHARLEFAAVARAEAEVLERNAAGEIVVTAAERARGKVSLFDWAADF